ncbi:MAG TPA: gamma-glutamylcyclotransferase family protein [Pirellulaceae bacterium]|nr:gamma-glutamylcyclotransferase family protein [Pirellulaceae bacterium]
MTLHFAYGANMSRKVMRRHAPSAQPVGAGQLAGYRFVITPDGYASLAPCPAEVVHGVLWRLTARDRVTLDAWENVAAGLYRARTLPVRVQGRRAQALVYLARPGGEGRPKPGYMELVMAAGREWDLPDAYLQALERWLPAGPPKVKRPAAKIGEFG